MPHLQKMYGLKLGRQGRLVIPAEVRRALGLKPGDTLVCQAQRDRLILKVRREIEEELWERFAGVKGSLSRELIGERKSEARHEAKG